MRILLIEDEPRLAETARRGGTGRRTTLLSERI
jgi:hypothetical protein